MLTKPALSAAIEELLREKGTLHRTDIEFYIFEACAHEHPGYEAFASEALRGGIGANVSVALSELLDSGRVAGPSTEGFSIPARAETCRDCGVALDADNSWEPGTCLACVRKVPLSELTFGYTPVEDAVDD